MSDLLDQGLKIRDQAIEANRECERLGRKLNRASLDSPGYAQLEAEYDAACELAIELQNAFDENRKARREERRNR